MYVFLYDKEVFKLATTYAQSRGEIKWGKSLSAIVTNGKFLTTDNQIYTYRVHHTRSAGNLFEGDPHLSNKFGLWLVPHEDTHIAIALFHGGPMSAHVRFYLE